MCSELKNILWVGLGGMIGTLLRYTTFILFPSGWGLWIVNLLGSFVLAFVVQQLKNTKKEYTLFITTGLLGSFTTFSTVSGEWLNLMHENILLGMCYGFVMTLACILVAALGYKLGGDSL